ncbi:MAG: hypothetical protein MUF40_04640, partial [Gemmatimonadaceae bacterium]|nr:hypothetical protein [Gemmatimonadaceae bacterium]
IDLRLADNKVQGASVWGASRARAVSPDRDLVADSIWVRMPGQSLRELRAFRQAVAQTVPDTATIRTGEKDWLRGDTIVAWFDSTRAMAAADSAAKPPVRQARTDTVTKRPSAGDTATVRLLALEARGHASARTQVAGEGSTPEKPGINYARGRTIRLVMDSTSEVERVEVDDDAVGVYLEPVPAGVAPPTPPAAGTTPTAPTPTAPPSQRTPTPARPATGRP